MIWITYTFHDIKPLALAHSVGYKSNLMWYVSISLKSAWWKYKNTVAWMNHRDESSVFWGYEYDVYLWLLLTNLSKFARVADWMKHHNGMSSVNHNTAFHCSIETKLWFRPLSHLPLLPHICVSKLGHHCFRQWLVAWSAPSQYLKQC